MEVREEIFTVSNFNQKKNRYETENNKFWFIEVDIIEYYLRKVNQSIQSFFYENLKYFQSQSFLFEKELLTEYLNYLYKNSRYDSFISFFDDYKKRFLEEKEIKINFFNQFNELFRSLNEYYRSQIDFIKLILNNLYKHKIDLQLTFNIDIVELTSIELGVGDIHEDGYSTAILNFNGKKLMLKRGDNHTKLVIDLYNIFLLQNNLSQVQLKSLEYGDFYYEEFLENDKIVNVNYLMRSFGVLLFLAYLLGLTDLHYDNIVISNDTIIPIDCETIFNANKVKRSQTYDLSDSVYTSFLLPFRRINNCFLSGISSEDTVFIGNKEYVLEISKSSLTIKENLSKEMERDSSSLQGNNLYDFTGLIMKSFEESYLYFIQNKVWLIQKIENMISDKKHRVLLKNTSEYVNAITGSYAAFLMIDTHDRIEFFKDKNKFNKKEICSMVNNVIPTFYEKITVDKNYYNKFTINDMQIQLQLIKSAINFELFEKKHNNNKERYNLNEREYYNFLYKELVETSSDSFWIDVVSYKINDEEISELIKVPNTIYAGKSGICLFLLEYAYRNNLLTKNSKIHILMKEIYDDFIKIVKNKYSSCGIYDGTSGIFYLIYIYQKYTNNIDKKKLFSLLYSMIDNVKYDKQLDMISGQAGLLKLLIYLSNNGEEDDRIKEGIINIQNNLIHAIKDSGGLLKNNKYLGYSHGLLGIVSVLAESSKINHQVIIEKVVEDLVSYLSRLMDTEKGFPSTYEKVFYYNSWCHGNSGFLLGLYNIYKVFKSDGLLLIIKKLLRVLEKDSANNFKLCHGNLGNYLICYNVSSNINDLYYKKLFKSKLNILTQRLSKEDFKYYNKNIMVGLSGLFYWKVLDWDMKYCLDVI